MSYAGCHKVTFQVDTGATVNTLPARYADNTKPITRKLKMWNNTDTAPLEICHTVVKNPKNKKTYSIEFVVVSDNYTPLLGYKAAKMMKLMNRKFRCSAAKLWNALPAHIREAKTLNTSEKLIKTHLFLAHFGA